MDISAALTETEVELLSDPQRACEDAIRQLEKHGIDQDGSNIHEMECFGAFEDSLRVKNTLDAVEEQGMHMKLQMSSEKLIRRDTARATPSWQALSILVNCEYKLYLLNRSTPLRKNPFLSHWVEAIQRLEQPAAKHVARSDDAITNKDVNAVRVHFIKAILQSRDSFTLAQKTPKQLSTDLDSSLQTTSFDLRPYIRMLEEEDIYERTLEPLSPQDHTPNNDNGAASYPGPRQKLSDFQQWKQDLISRLGTSPSTAIPELTHLPIELSTLDFLTTLLQDRTLQTLAIDPAPVISDYIQHALRLTEKMGQPPDDDVSGSSSLDSGIGDLGGGDHGREAQTRAVKLLLLFVKNLIRKDLVGVEAIYFDIQEICVRYVWVREVREFRSFIEQGEGGGNGIMGGWVE
jgi:hypothetical protein